MSYVDPKIKDQFESLTDDLKSAILQKDVKLNSMTDLMRVLEQIVAEE